MDVDAKCWQLISIWTVFFYARRRLILNFERFGRVVTSIAPLQRDFTMPNPKSRYEAES